MNRNFYPIGQKINSIKNGLLRYRENNENISRHMVMKAFDEQVLLCALIETGRLQWSHMYSYAEIIAF